MRAEDPSLCDVRKRGKPPLQERHHIDDMPILGRGKLARTPLHDTRGRLL